MPQPNNHSFRVIAQVIKVNNKLVQQHDQSLPDKVQQSQEKDRQLPDLVLPLKTNLETTDATPALVSTPSSAMSDELTLDTLDDSLTVVSNQEMATPVASAQVDLNDKNKKSGGSVFLLSIGLLFAVLVAAVAVAVANSTPEQMDQFVDQGKVYLQQTRVCLQQVQGHVQQVQAHVQEQLSAMQLPGRVA